jgi:hypothetical protein
MIDNFPFKVVRTNSHDEVLTDAVNLLIGRAAFEAAARGSIRRIGSSTGKVLGSSSAPNRLSRPRVPIEPESAGAIPSTALGVSAPLGPPRQQFTRRTGCCCVASTLKWADAHA